MPPTILLDDCSAPTMPAELMSPGTVREYASAATRWAIDLEEALAACNADKQALRAFYGAMDGKR